MSKRTLTSEQQVALWWRALRDKKIAGTADADVYGWVWTKKNKIRGPTKSACSLIRGEARRILTTTVYQGKKSDLAKSLSRWLARVHQDAPQRRPRTIEGHITDLWRARRR